MDTYEVSGKAYWASVTAPNTVYDPVWCVDVCLDDDGKSLIESLGLNVQNKGDDRGDFIKIKRKVYKRDGTQRKAPVIKDSQNNLWDGSLIGNGSQVNVKFSTFEWDYNKKKGITTDLISLQVIDLVEYKGSSSDFSPVAGGYVVGGGESAEDVPF